MKHLLISAVLSAGMATSAVGATIADQFSSFVVLGDSLSDNGNTFALTGQPPLPYFQGRVSNGPVWNEAIAAEFGGFDNPFLTGTLGGANNLAFAGSRADDALNPNGPLPSLNTQIVTYGFAGGTFLPDTLLSVWSGANDIFQDLPLGVGTDVGNETASDLGLSLTSLVALGARNLLVFNLPDFGIIPRFANDPLVQQSSDAVTAYNASLDATLDALELANSDLEVFRVDVFSIFNDIVDNPAAFGLANATDVCVAALSCVFGGEAVQDSFLFWDDVHPTAAGHRLIEAAARSALAPSAVPLPAGAPLYLLALAGFGLVSRRRA